MSVKVKMKGRIFLKLLRTRSLATIFISPSCSSRIHCHCYYQSNILESPILPATHFQAKDLSWASTSAINAAFKCVANPSGVNLVGTAKGTATSSVMIAPPQEGVTNAVQACRMCVYCVEEGKNLFPCCGLALCGASNGEVITDPKEAAEMDDDKKTCASKHVMKTLDCGHKGCNFQGEKCLTCENATAAKKEKKEAEEDIAVINSIMGKIKNHKIKSALKAIATDPEGKKRKRENEHIEELESNLKRARNACNACRCGRASYY